MIPWTAKRRPIANQSGGNYGIKQPKTSAGKLPTKTHKCGVEIKKSIFAITIKKVGLHRFPAFDVLGTFLPFANDRVLLVCVQSKQMARSWRHLRHYHIESWLLNSLTSIQVENWLDQTKWITFLPYFSLQHSCRELNLKHLAPSSNKSEAMTVISTISAAKITTPSCAKAGRCLQWGLSVTTQLLLEQKGVERSQVVSPPRLKVPSTKKNVAAPWRSWEKGGL